MKTVTDKIGQEILPGCFIAYGHSLGRCGGLRIGKVLAVEAREKSCPADSDCRVRVLGIDDDWDDEPKLNNRVGTLQYSKRIVVLYIMRMPVKILELFLNNPLEPEIHPPA
jgi:hypothetical protein